ncbi:FecCD family ABC transporter permease [Amaricoccus solimangrovi]|uniref:Iron ABC transporter permease n=1 Tax=Amaricoccus solimangrovi TaxID=2589815 RepID=A0A501WML3_9RHOB|nr:iron ABC transporter permease [Amaricoccus solimangrovi]TPE49580.1 iron ABC transporter permease [Amaricoccus solimangrovi]
MKAVLGAALALLLVTAASLALGVRPIGPSDYLDMMLAFDPTNADHVALATVRLPRVLGAIIAGGALGVAGAVLQGITRNPLADPGLLGINAGAAFALLAGGALLGDLDQTRVAMLTFPGAALAALTVFGLAGGLRGDTGPMRLTLAGAALNALLLSLVTGAVLLRRESLDMMRFWVAGSLAPAGSRPLAEMALAAAAGAILALAIAPRIEALSFGHALARGLGIRPGRTQGMALAAVALTTGAAVAVAGPIAFLGLMVPPLARRLVGHRLRMELVTAFLLGGATLLLCDTLGRLVLAPAEVRVGVMTAVIGGPVFIWIARGLRPGAQA